MKKQSENKLLSKYPNEKNIIKKIFQIRKYSDEYYEYIENTLDDFLNSVTQENGSLSLSDEKYLYGVYSFFLPWFFSNKDLIKKEDIISANERYKEKTGNNITNINELINNPSDINLYNDFEFVKNIVLTVQNKKTPRNIYKEAKSKSEIIYDDEKNIIIKLTSYESACYYGKEAEWCRSRNSVKNNISEYYDLTKNNELYIIINKSNKNKNYFLKNINQGKIQYFDIYGDIITLSKFNKEAIGSGVDPKLLGKIFETSKITTFEGLRAIYKNNTITDKHYFHNIDDIIEKVDFKSPRGSSNIIIEFTDSDKFYEMMGFSSDDIWNINRVLYGSSYDEFEYDSDYESFREGSYPYSLFNDENKKILFKIAAYVSGVKEDNIRYLSQDEEFNKTLINLFPRSCEELVSCYNSVKREQMFDSFREDLNYKISQKLNKYGFTLIDNEKISTTVSNLIFLYSTKGTFKSSLFLLLESIFNGDETYVMEIYEYEEYRKFDLEQFNDCVNPVISNILEKLEDDLGSEYLNLIKYVSEKFRFNVWYDVPANKDLIFQIKKIDPSNNKINVLIKTRLNSGSNRTKEHSFDKESFEKFLYNPEIFPIL